jgi:putative ABC transport system ATP-binding protein
MPRFDLLEVTRLRPPGAGGIGRPALAGITLTIPDGAGFVVTGPSGSGKTSLLRLLNRLDDPTSGDIGMDGCSLRTLSPLTLRRRVGMVCQVPFLFPGTVRDNLAMALSLGGGREPRRLAAPSEASWGGLLEDVGLDPSFLGRDADRLSVGEMQRVSVARALACGPEALLLDEPTSALDAASASRLLETLSSLRRSRGLTLVLVTHLLGEARGIATHALRLEAGRMAAVGPAQEILG